MTKEYALYKGDKLLGIGTVRQLANQFNVKHETMAWYKHPANARRDRAGKRRVLIPIDDGDDEE